MKWDWELLGRKVDETAFTVLFRCNDPVIENTGWLDEAIDSIPDSVHHRYSPFVSKDEYPVKPINLGITLARFFYEYLFPVHLGNETGDSKITQLTVTNQGCQGIPNIPDGWPLPVGYFPN